MRVLLVHPGPSFSVQDVYDGWAEGFETLGHEVAHYNLGERLTWGGIAHLSKTDGTFIRAFNEPEDVYQFALSGLSQSAFYWWPDLIVFVSGFILDPQFIAVCRSRGMKTACIFTESPYEDTRQLAAASTFDVVALNDPTNLAQFQELTNAIYTPHAYRPSVHYPGEISIESRDCIFVGTGYPSRVAFMERCDWSGIELGLAGNWQNVPESLTERVVHDVEDCIDNSDTAELYRRSRTSFNLYRTETNGDVSDTAEGWAVGPREIELAASGCWQARQSRGESDELFPMLPTFNSPEELGELIRWALAHPQERAAQAALARAAVKDRTFPNNARQLITAAGF